MKVVVIGGGPVGVEAALYGACAGFNVHLYERGEIADNIRRWGFVQVFTEWGRNRSPLAVKMLRERGVSLLPDAAYSSGDELAAYVHQIASLQPLQGRVTTHTYVLGITREACLRSDFIGQSRREEFAFRLLLRDASGSERIENCDAVIDATGVYSSPNWAGSGGAPCPGELQNKDRIDYALPDVLGRDRARFANKTTLVVGSGHSSASTLLAVADLMEAFPATKLVWVVRRSVPQHGAPYTLVPEETSTTRARLHRRANELVHHPNVTFLHSSVVESIAYDREQFQVEITTHDGAGTRSLPFPVDNLAAHTGFRADTTLWSELPVETHPPTGAPRRLGEALQAHNHRSGVGLSTGYAEKQPQEEEEEKNAPDRWSFLINDPQLLHTGEPNFYVLGIKSYGRDAGFLMHNGFRQVRDVYKLISGNPDLDLYEGALDLPKNS